MEKSEGNRMQMNLQLFGEGADDANVDEQGNGVENPEVQNEEKKDETPTVEQLMADLAKERAEKAKLKNSLNEASSEAAKYKKQLREKQSAQEIEDEEKQKAAEAHNAYVADLEAFKKKAEAKARYALQGMDEKLATQAAEAEVSGDMDELASIQKKHTDNLLKEKEKEWLKNRPEVNVGNGEEDETATLTKEIEAIMLRTR